jgi:hypothetical protein
MLTEIIKQNVFHLLAVMAAIRDLLRSGGMLAGSSAGMATQVTIESNSYSNVMN